MMRLRSDESMRRLNGTDKKSLVRELSEIRNTRAIMKRIKGPKVRRAGVSID